MIGSGSATPPRPPAMLAYVVRRLAATVPVMLVVAVFVFSLLHLSPGDPAIVIAGDQASPADVARIRETLGLDRPYLEQFAGWLSRAVRGDLGQSIFSNLPVSHLIAQRIEPTLMLMLLTVTLAVSVAVPLGVLAAWTAGRWLDRTLMAVAVLGFSDPGLRHRLPARLAVRAAARVAAGAGLRTARRGAVAVRAQPAAAGARAAGCPSAPARGRAARGAHAPAA